MLKGAQIRQKNRKAVISTVAKGNALHPRKSKTQPNMSMDVKTIVERYLRGVPIDVVKREGTYDDDNNEVDLEKLGRLDPADKRFTASEYAAKAQAKREELKQISEESKRLNAEAERDKRKAEQPEQETGIEDLDNTMPDDTTLETKRLARSKGGRNK